MPDWLTDNLVGDVASGVAVTIMLTLITSATSLGVGIVAALARRSTKAWRRRLAAIYVDIFRNVPALILLIFFAFAVPNLVSAPLRRQLFFDNPVVDAAAALTGLPLPYYAFAAILALTANTGAHLAEIVRSGVDSIAPERLEAARSLGASVATVHRTITIPSALRISFPAITNRLIHNLKNTALVGFVAVPDAFQELQGTITRTFEAKATLTFAAFLYLTLAAVFELGLRLIERRLWRGRPIHRSVDV